MILPSHEDEAQHFGDPGPEETLARYRKAGAATVIVKNGAAAIHYADRGSSGAVTPPAVASVVDTTAAGDSFNAAVLCAMRNGQPTTEMIAAGCDLAGRVIGGRGALVRTG